MRLFVELIELDQRYMKWLMHRHEFYWPSISTDCNNIMLRVVRSAKSMAELRQPQSKTFYASSNCGLLENGVS